MQKTQGYLASSVNAFLALDDFPDAFVKGCSGEEITLLEKLLPAGCKLPFAYKEFLLFGGHCLADFRSHDHFFYQDILSRLKNDVLHSVYFTPGNIEESGLEGKIADDFFIIDTYQEDGIYFIRLGDGENPPVYSWVLYDGRFKKIAESFSVFFERLINDYVLYYRQVVARKKLPVRDKKINEFINKLHEGRNFFEKLQRESPCEAYSVFFSQFEKGINNCFALFTGNTNTYRSAFPRYDEKITERLKPVSGYHTGALDRVRSVSQLADDIFVWK